jgi:hypothetical protein
VVEAIGVPLILLGQEKLLHCGLCHTKSIVDNENNFQALGQNVVCPGRARPPWQRVVQRDRKRILIPCGV